MQKNTKKEKCDYLGNQENLIIFIEKWVKCVVAPVWCVTTSKTFARTHFAHMF